MINVKARKAEFRFEKPDGSGGVMVSMYCHKRPSGSVYSATAYVYEDTSGNGFTGTLFSPLEGARLFTKFVDRYSARTFTEFVEEAMANFPASVPAGSKVAAALADITL